MPHRQAPQYEVGYGRPPVAHQFKKGQSGNPKGRRKGSHSVESLFLKEMNELVVVQEGGQRKKIKKIEAAFKQMANKAASGDIRSFKMFVEIMKTPEWKAMNEALYPSPTVESPRERLFQKLELLRKRMEATENLESGITNSEDIVPPGRPPEF